MAQRIPGPLYYEEIGATGMPMIFLHSTPDDHRLWMYQTAHFSSDYRCLAVDCAGYGRSPAVQQGVTIDDHADACWEVVDRTTKGGAIIHGNSFGSEIAMRMAQRRPERVPALILSGCGYVPTSEIFRSWAERYRSEGLTLRHAQVIDHFAPEGQRSKLLLHYADMVCALNNEGTLASIVANNEALALRPDPSFYDGITAPTIIIIGDLEAPAAYDAHCIRFLRKHGLYHGATKAT